MSNSGQQQQLPCIDFQTSTIEPRTPPLYSCFEDIGMYEAHRRLLRGMKAHWHGNVERTRDLEGLPLWLCDPSTPLEVVAGALDVAEAMGAVHQLQRLRMGVAEELRSQRLPAETFDPVQPVVAPGMDPCLVVALARLVLGDALESFVALKAQRVCRPTDTLSVRDPHCKYMARLFQDSYLMAVWTSAHAQYVANAFDRIDHHSEVTRKDEDMVETSPSSDGLETVVDVSNVCTQLGLPGPELYSVPCTSNTPDLSALYERTSEGKTCNKASQHMLSVLARATNAGSRGWEATLMSALQHSEGATRLCHHAIQVALCGLHPCLHPLARPPWQQRLKVTRANPLVVNRTEMPAFSKCASNAVKEAIRLSLASLLNENMATLSVYMEINQSTGQLAMPPFKMPAVSMQACMQSFVAVGVEVSTAVHTVTEMAEKLTSKLSSEPRSRKKACTLLSSGAKPVKHDGPHPLVNVVYCCSWMGGRMGNGNAAPLSVSTILSGLLAASFRAEYTLFWMHATMHNERLSRLDDAQHRALHHQNPCHQLVAMLESDDALQAQRLALRMPQASLLSMQTVSEILNLTANDDETEDDSANAQQFGGGTTSTSNRAVQEGEASVMRLNGKSMARLTLFAQTASLRNQLLTYDLGVETRRRQIQALMRRFLVDKNSPEVTADMDVLILDPSHPCPNVIKHLPMHATHVFVCSECRRIVNACQSGVGKNAPFNELGLSASMLRIDGALSDGEMRCAKRSSAALRTAVSLEELADERQVECQACSFPIPSAMPFDLRPGSVVQPHVNPEDPERAERATETASEVAKLRRDIKNCFEQNQKAVACGDVPLVHVDILGRCIRLFHEWYCLCSLCGSLMRMTAGTRFGGEPCCQRCDFAMLFGKPLHEALLERQPKPPPPMCRLCGKPQPPTSNSKWRVVNAPADTGGRNASVPPPLRQCW